MTFYLPIIEIVSISYHFSDIVNYLSKAANFSCPTCIWCPHWWPCWNFNQIFSIRNLLEFLGYRAPSPYTHSYRLKEPIL